MSADGAIASVGRHLRDCPILQEELDWPEPDDLVRNRLDHRGVGATPLGAWVLQDETAILPGQRILRTPHRVTAP
jgi:hypothetical protein